MHGSCNILLDMPARCYQRVSSTDYLSSSSSCASQCLASREHVSPSTYESEGPQPDDAVPPLLHHVQPHKLRSSTIYSTPPNTNTPSLCALFPCVLGDTELARCAVTVSTSLGMPWLSARIPLVYTRPFLSDILACSCAYSRERTQVRE